MLSWHKRLARYEASPEEFGGAEGWLTMARTAHDNAPIRQYSAGEWETVTGQRVGGLAGPIIASGLWTIYDDYEALRLGGLFLSPDAYIKATEARNLELRNIRGCASPECVTRYRAAVWILDQAREDPARRKPFSRSIRDLDLEAKAVTLRRRR